MWFTVDLARASRAALALAAALLLGAQACGNADPAEIVDDSEGAAVDAATDVLVVSDTSAKETTPVPDVAVVAELNDAVADVDAQSEADQPDLAVPPEIAPVGDAPQPLDAAQDAAEASADTSVAEIPDIAEPDAKQPAADVVAPDAAAVNDAAGDVIDIADSLDIFAVQDVVPAIDAAAAADMFETAVAADAPAKDAPDASDIAAKDTVIVPLPSACSPANCDDANLCTFDKCDKLKGCSHIDNTLTCSDANACTVGDACLNGVCVTGKSINCDDGLMCTKDSCDIASAKCGHSPIFGCICSTLADCDDGEPCTLDVCTALNTCTHAAKVTGAPCNDGSVCTTPDLCYTGVCKGYLVKDCDDGNACSDDACDPLTGKCSNIVVPDKCDDGNPCTTDTCEAAKGCVHWGKFFDRKVGGEVNDVIKAVVAMPVGWVMAGRNDSLGPGKNNFWLLRMDDLGRMTWQSVFGGEKEDVATCLVAVEKGFTLAGYTASMGKGGNDFWMVNTDALGAMKWNKTYGGAGDEQANAIVTQPDGYVLAGGTSSKGAGGKDVWLVHTNITGAVTWDKTYGAAGEEQAFAMVALEDGLAVLALTKSKGAGDADFWLLRTDKVGNLLWDKTYGGKGVEVPHALVALADGFALAGQTGSKGAGGNDFWLIRTDLLGNTLWEKTYGGKGDDAAYALAGLADGFAITGKVISDNNKEQAYLLRTDPFGTVLWQRKYGEAFETANGIAVLPDGFILAGLSSNADQSKCAGRMWRTDDWGHVTCDESGICYNKTWADCDDGNVCSADLCESVQGCASASLIDGAPCGDGVACAGGACL